LLYKTAGIESSKVSHVVDTIWPDGSTGQAQGVEEVVTRQDGSQFIRSSPLFLVNHGSVPLEFTRKVDRTLLGIPHPIRETLYDNGARVHIGQTVHEMGQRLGMEVDESDFTVDGGHADRQAMIASQFKWGGRLVAANNPVGVARHEIAHSLDDVLGEFSSTPIFKKAHSADVSEIPSFKTTNAGLDYYIRGEDGSVGAGIATRSGRREAFAAGSAIAWGGDDNGTNDWLIKTHFPRTIKLIAQLLREMPWLD
jgi:hypothetical protein